jgi:uncharacterized protein DUF1844
MPGGQSEDGKKHPGFTVSDRRSSAESGSTTDEPGASAETGASASQSQTLPPIDFHTFILSLGSSALLHLGELDGPDGGPSEPDLPLAKHTIDVIAMLQAKTQGNLTPPEANLVESLLYDLRLRYVEKTKAAPPVT